MTRLLLESLLGRGVERVFPLVAAARAAARPRSFLARQPDTLEPTRSLQSRALALVDQAQLRLVAVTRAHQVVAAQMDLGVSMARGGLKLSVARPSLYQVLSQRLIPLMELQVPVGGMVAASYA